MNIVPAYPAGRRGRDQYVLERRGPRPRHDPWRHQGVLVEDERAADGGVVRVATVFLTGRECPWRCVMCDLWQHTIAEDTARGALVRQLDSALESLQADGTLPDHLKLYNAGNFFDPRAVPEGDYDAIAGRLTPFKQIIVESHPALIGDRLLRFTGALARAAGSAMPPGLEVAMGLETANPGALERLNKGFTLAQFARSASRLLAAGASLRVFLLVGVPFIPAEEQQEWVARSVAFASACGASVVSLIPTRSGGGALEELRAAGAFRPPTLDDMETALVRGLAAAPIRVFADLWDLRRFSRCPSCLDDRRERLRRINLEQHVTAPVHCNECGVTATGGPA